MTSKNAEAPPLWQFVPLAQYVKPLEAAAETVGRGLSGIWHRLRSTRQPEPEQAAQMDLEPVPVEILDQAAARPSWDDAVQALDETLAPWLELGRTAYPLQAVVGAPYSGIGQIASHWAARNNERVIEPPEAEAILAGETACLNALDADDEALWVIPHLEKWYLRHANGLVLMRELFKLLTARRRPTLIGCDSWAWAFLGRIAELGLVAPSPFVLAAFDQERLNRWLQSLCRLDGEPWSFQHPDGALVLIPDEASRVEPDRTSDFLARLAAYSRGIPGVAWAVWRHSLCFCTQPGEDETPEPERIIHVAPWRRLDLPSLPKGESWRFAHLLHTLLLHGGVDPRLLPALLPGSAELVRQELFELATAGLLETDRTICRVSALGYHAVWQFLQDEGYLTDAF